jgi:hypothetical protein
MMVWYGMPKHGGSQVASWKESRSIEFTASMLAKAVLIEPVLIHPTICQLNL